MSIESKAHPLSAVFSQLSAEVQTIEKLVSDVENTLSATIGKYPHVSAKDLSDFQNFDLLGQTLSCLRHFLSTAAIDMPSDWMFDPHPAVEGIHLRDLAERLSAPGMSCDNIKKSNAGSVRLF